MTEPLVRRESQAIAEWFESLGTYQRPPNQKGWYASLSPSMLSGGAVSTCDSALQTLPIV